APHARAVFLCNAPPTTEIYTLSLHDALPISAFKAQRAFARVDRASVFERYVDPENARAAAREGAGVVDELAAAAVVDDVGAGGRSEEHTSELQSRDVRVCRLLQENYHAHRRG